MVSQIFQLCSGLKLPHTNSAISEKSGVSPVKNSTASEKSAGGSSAVSAAFKLTHSPLCSSTISLPRTFLVPDSRIISNLSSCNAVINAG